MTPPCSIGPYIDAEYNFGGLPYWLRNIPDLRCRTSSPSWIQQMGNFIKTVGTVVKPYLAPAGPHYSHTRLFRTLAVCSDGCVKSCRWTGLYCAGDCWKDPLRWLSALTHYWRAEQIENEYHLIDPAYVDWMGSFVDSLGWGIPWEMCNGEYANNTIESCNSCEGEPVRSLLGGVLPGLTRIRHCVCDFPVGARTLLGAAE
jgi:hypothetical protein